MTDAAIEESYLQLIAEAGWPGATLSALAAKLETPLARVIERHPTRFDLLAAVGRWADLKAVAGADGEGGSQAVRDRLFELIMARLDALSAHRPAVRALMRAARLDPGLAGFFARQLPRSMTTLAECAGVDASGVLGGLKVKALTALYLSVARTWLEDESEDLAKTMAALDKALAQAESWANRIPQSMRASAA
jgi:ubiquinone biosynthesis protein COQ9